MTVLLVVKLLIIHVDIFILATAVLAEHATDVFDPIVLVVRGQGKALPFGLLPRFPNGGSKICIWIDRPTTTALPLQLIVIVIVIFIDVIVEQGVTLLAAIMRWFIF
jgi:hypothetical protein